MSRSRKNQRKKRMKGLSKGKASKKKEKVTVLKPKNTEIITIEELNTNIEENE